jgi:two-component system, cell cycle response regulator DivK
MMISTLFSVFPGSIDSDGHSEESNASTTSRSTIILVVEDNVGNFKLISRLLNSLGVQCEWKTSGYEVVEFASTLSHIDLVLMDIRLPYEDGYGAMRKIRQSGLFTDIPIVAVTAVSGVDQMKAAKLAGFDGFIGKPLDPDRFPEQIHRILSGQEVWEYN